MHCNAREGDVDTDSAVNDERPGELHTLERLFRAIESIPEDLHDRTLDDPEVRQIILDEFDAAAVDDDSTARSWPQCAAAVATFIAENALPAGKVYRLIKEAGGFKKFAEIVYYFLRNGSFPAHASEEMAELLVGLTGLPAVASACA